MRPAPLATGVLATGAPVPDAGPMRGASSLSTRDRVVQRSIEVVR